MKNIALSRTGKLEEQEEREDQKEQEQEREQQYKNLDILKAFPRVSLMNRQLSDDELVRLYKACDVFVLPTRGEVNNNDNNQINHNHNNDNTEFTCTHTTSTNKINNNKTGLGSPPSRSNVHGQTNHLHQLVRLSLFPHLL